MVVDDNLRMYIGQGHEGLPAAAAPPQPDVLRHHRPEPGRHLGARRSRRTTSWRRWRASTSGSSTIARGLDMDTVNIRAVYDIDPVDTLAHRLRRPASAMRPTPCCTTRARARTPPSMDAGALADALAAGRLGQGGAGPVPGDPQAGDRRAAAHLAPGVDRGRGQRRLPGPEARVPEPAATQRRRLNAMTTPSRNRQDPQHPAGTRRVAARPGGHARRRGRAGRPARGPAAAARGRGRHGGDAIRRGAGADLHPGRGRRLRPAGVLPRRRVLPGQPGHPRPRRAVPGQGNRLQGHLRRLPPGPRGRLPGRPRRLLRGASAGRRRTARASAGTARTSPSPATARAATSSPPSPRRPTTTGSTAITHQVLFYPSLDLDFDVDRYASLRENAEGYGLETAGLMPFNSFYLESGADPGGSPRLPHQARGPRRPAAGTDHHRRVRPAARRGRALRPAPDGGRRGRDGQPLRRGQPRLRPELLLDPGVPPGLRGDG